MINQIIFFPNERVFLTFLMEVCITLILIILTRNLYGRYRERKHPATKYLTLMGLFLSLTTCLQLIDLFLIDPFTTYRRLGLGLAFSASAIANIFLYLFIHEIFSSGKKAGGIKLRVFVVIEGAVAVLVPILGPLLYFGFVLMLLVHLVFSLSLYVMLVRVTSIARNKTDDHASRVGFSLLRIGGVMIIMAYVLFVMDAIWTLLVTSGEGYTYWVIFAWIAAGLSGIQWYLGFVLPIHIRTKEEKINAG